MAPAFRKEAFRKVPVFGEEGRGSSRTCCGSCLNLDVASSFQILIGSQLCFEFDAVNLGVFDGWRQHGPFGTSCGCMVEELAVCRSYPGFAAGLWRQSVPTHR